MVQLTMSERLIKVETVLNEHTKQDVVNHTETLCAIKEMNKKLDNLGTKFANKWVEKGVITLAIVGLTLILTLIGYII